MAGDRTGRAGRARLPGLAPPCVAGPAAPPRVDAGAEGGADGRGARRGRLPVGPGLGAAPDRARCHAPGAGRRVRGFAAQRLGRGRRCAALAAARRVGPGPARADQAAGRLLATRGGLVRHRTRTGRWRTCAPGLRPRSAGAGVARHDPARALGLGLWPRPRAGCRGADGLLAAALPARSHRLRRRAARGRAAAPALHRLALAPDRPSARRAQPGRGRDVAAARSDRARAGAAGGGSRPPAGDGGAQGRAAPLCLRQPTAAEGARPARRAADRSPRRGGAGRRRARPRLARRR